MTSRLGATRTIGGQPLRTQGTANSRSNAAPPAFGSQEFDEIFDLCHLLRRQRLDFGDQALFDDGVHAVLRHMVGIDRPLPIPDRLALGFGSAGQFSSGDQDSPKARAADQRRAGPFRVVQCTQAMIRIAAALGRRPMAGIAGCHHNPLAARRHVDGQTASLGGHFMLANRGICVFGCLALATLAGCGGGGGPTPGTPALSISIASVAADGTTLAKNANLSGSFALANLGASDPTPSVTIQASFDGCPGTVLGTVTLDYPSRTFTVTHPDFGNGLSCTYTLTPSVNGSPGSARLGSFKTDVAVFHYTDLVLTVFGGGTLGRIVPDTTTASGWKSIALVNKSAYTTGAAFPLALCATVWDGTTVHKESDGSPTISCVTPAVGNLRRYFAVNPLTNEIGAEVATPAGVTLRDVGYGFGTTGPYAAQGISEFGRFAVAGRDILFILDTDSLNLRVAPAGDFSKSIVVDDGKLHSGFQFFGVYSN